jgi:biotin carboxyl carrier protein
MKRVVRIDGERHAMDVRVAGDAFEVSEESLVVDGTRRGDGGRLLLELGPARRRATAHVVRAADGRLEVWIDSERHVVEEERRGAGGAAANGAGPAGDAIAAPMPAKVVRIAVAAGDAVEEGQTLVVLESMKMELGVTAPRAGRVARVAVVAGVLVPAGTVLVELEPAGAGAGA